MAEPADGHEPAAAAQDDDSSPIYVKKTNFKVPSDCIDVSKQAHWCASGSKSEHGVDKLMDDSLETFWQSDGLAPHSIIFQFPKRTALCKLAFCVNYHEDESYTPEEVSISCGTMRTNLEEIMSFTLSKPSGWVHVPLGDAKLEGQNAFLRTFVLKVSAKKMHQSGRDTRIRLIRLVGPKPSAGTAGAGAALTDAAASFELHSTRMHTMR